MNRPLDPPQRADSVAECPVECAELCNHRPRRCSSVRVASSLTGPWAGVTGQGINESVNQQITERFRENLRRAEHIVTIARPEVPRPPSIWSPLQCLDHLNRASESVLATLSAGASDASGAVLGNGVLLTAVNAPWTRWLKAKSPPQWIPAVAPSVADVIADFRRLQEQLIVWCQSLDSRHWPMTRVTWQAAPNKTLSPYWLMSVTEAHQRRHFSQASPYWRPKSFKTGGFDEWNPLEYR